MSAEVEAFLLPRPGESLADKTMWPPPFTRAEEAVLDRCFPGRNARRRAERISIAEQLDAATRSMRKIDKRCLELGLDAEQRVLARMKDARALVDVRAIAATIRKTKTCGHGERSPAGDPCKLPATMSWSDPGWACLAKAMDPSRAVLLETSPAYAYSFDVDDERRIYRVVARGCHPGYGETELVMRGALDGSEDDAVILRRAPLAER